MMSMGWFSLVLILPKKQFRNLSGRPYILIARVFNRRVNSRSLGHIGIGGYLWLSDLDRVV